MMATVWAERVEDALICQVTASESIRAVEAFLVDGLKPYGNG